MVIKFKCSKCLRVLAVRDEDAGKKTKCPRCETFLRIPGAPAKAQVPGSTALHEAAEKGDAGAAEKLLTVGADVNARNREGRTALHLAANVRVAMLLLEKGADVKAKSNNGETPLHVAASWGRRDVGETLVEAGADLNSQTNAGKTPLHNAAMAAHADMVEFLVQEGANMKVKASDGWTALDVAKWGVSAGENVAYKKVLEVLTGQMLKE